MFGFLQESIIGVEQESGYGVEAGYLKGADVAAKNLSFFVIPRDGTASKLIVLLYMVQCWSWVTTGTGEGSNNDYIVSTTNVMSLFNTPIPRGNVEFILIVDNVALENNETFSLRLVPSTNTTLPTGEGVFFLDTLGVTIVDTDSEW